MKAIVLLFDSLKKNWLPPYGGDILAPNFARLAGRCLTFDNFYVGSLPCMPARREMHTGRYNFLHEGWGPLEPFDDSVPQLLKEKGVHTHLVSDHHHYWREGGAHYHTSYTTYEHIRGQEGDPWKADLTGTYPLTAASEHIPPPFDRMFRQDAVNRTYMACEQTHCQTLVFDAGLEFLQKNGGAETWFLQVECFDPHEPFYTFQEYRDLYPGEYHGRHVDWPSPAPVTEEEAYVQYVQNQYKALVSMIDKNLGRLLDEMDRQDLWKDTLLMVGTDHGLLLGEHDWWSKGVMPAYNDIANIPFFLWDPRHKAKAQRRKALAQNIDVAATLLDYFGLPLPPDMEGKPLAPVAENDTPIHDYVLFGYHGGMANITDGRYVYMRGPAQRDNAPLYAYTLIPAHMNSRAGVNELKDATLSPPFRFTKGCPVLKIDASRHRHPLMDMHRFGHRLYDLHKDPGQLHPIHDPKTELRLIGAMMDLMEKNDAPREQYERLGLSRDMTAETLKKEREAFEKSFVPPILPDCRWDREAASQYLALAGLFGGAALEEPFTSFVRSAELAHITCDTVGQFAMKALPEKQRGLAIMMLAIGRKLD